MVRPESSMTTFLLLFTARRVSPSCASMLFLRPITWPGVELLMACCSSFQLLTHLSACTSTYSSPSRTVRFGASSSYVNCRRAALTAAPSFAFSPLDTLRGMLYATKSSRALPPRPPSSMVMTSFSVMRMLFACGALLPVTTGLPETWSPNAAMPPAPMSAVLPCTVPPFRCRLSLLHQMPPAHPVEWLFLMAQSSTVNV